MAQGPHGDIDRWQRRLAAAQVRQRAIERALEALRDPSVSPTRRRYRALAVLRLCDAKARWMEPPTSPE